MVFASHSDGFKCSLYSSKIAPGPFSSLLCILPKLGLHSPGSAIRCLGLLKSFLYARIHKEYNRRRYNIDIVVATEYSVYRNNINTRPYSVSSLLNMSDIPTIIFLDPTNGTHISLREKTIACSTWCQVLPLWTGNTACN
jgi:hypothetical protein